MELQAQIESMLAHLLEGTSYFPVDVSVMGVKSVPKITILLDGDEGIGIDKCAEVSRKLGAQLEEREDLLPGAFTLEVSSPGLDTPLKLPRQYAKNVGRRVKIKLKDGSERTGRLEAATAEAVTVTLDPEKGKKKATEVAPVALSLADVDKIFVLVSF